MDIMQPLNSMKNHSFQRKIIFKIKKHLPFGKALYVCGNLAQLGSWQPHKALKLKWREGNEWIGKASISNKNHKCAQFKFIISDWNLKQKSNIEWQIGQFNRKLNLYTIHSCSQYIAQWNKHRIILCLHSPSNNYSSQKLFVSGSTQQLGAWIDIKEMNPISQQIKVCLSEYIKNDSEFSYEPKLAELYAYSFNISLDINLFSYFYIRKGDTAKHEDIPVRIVKIKQNLEQDGRIMQFQWNGSTIIIDESSFDSIFLQRMTNQIFLASYLKNSTQFNKIVQKNITAILDISRKDETYTFSNYHFKKLCLKYNIFLQNLIVQELSSAKFVLQAENILSILEELLTRGHRVCIHCSNDIMLSTPIKVLYLTTFVGYSLRDAIQLMSNQSPLSESSCQIAQDLLHLVRAKMLRGCKVTICTS